MLNTPSHINMLCMSTNFHVQGAYPYCVDAVAICKLRGFSGKNFMLHKMWYGCSSFTKYFENCCMGHSQFSCDITWASLQLFLHSCSYGLFIGWCPYILWVTWIHKCNSCRTLPVVWRYCCYYWNLATSRWCHPWKYSVYCCAPVPAKLLLVPSVKGTSQYSWCVYSVIIGYNWALLCSVLCLKNYVSQDIYNILKLFFKQGITLWRAGAQIFFHSVYM
jgi:hypothetical protein